jgi:hypothetical protein
MYVYECVGGLQGDLAGGKGLGTDGTWIDLEVMATQVRVQGTGRVAKRGYESLLQVSFRCKGVEGGFRVSKVSSMRSCNLGRSIPLTPQ